MQFERGFAGKGVRDGGLREPAHPIGDVVTFSPLLAAWRAHASLFPNLTSSRSSLVYARATMAETKWIFHEHRRIYLETTDRPNARSAAEEMRHVGSIRITWRNYSLRLS